MAELEQDIQQPPKTVHPEMAASINLINDACKTVKNGTEYWKILKGRSLNSAVPCLLWINLFKSCKVNIALQWSIIRQTYKKKHVMCTSCMVDSVEMTPEVRISRTCIEFGVIFGVFNPLKPELNPIFYLLALLGAQHFLHISRIRVKLLTFRLLMSYIYGAPILDVSRSHTTTQHSQ